MVIEYRKPKNSEFSKITFKYLEFSHIAKSKYKSEGSKNVKFGKGYTSSHPNVNNAIFTHKDFPGVLFELTLIPIVISSHKKGNLSSHIWTVNQSTPR